MKKLIALGAAGALALALASGPAGAAGKGKKQVVEGSIAAPAPFTDDSGCYAGMHRRTAVATMGNNQGVIGYHFDIDKATLKKPFVLEVTGGQNSPDLDIYFYQEFGDLMQIAGDPTGAPPGATAQFNTRAPGGESGIVPDLMKKVIVCMYGGQLGAGAAVNFTYTAGKGVKLPKN